MPHSSLEEVWKVSTGWTAQFELHDTKPKEPLITGEWQFDLEADEAMRQTQYFSKAVSSNGIESDGYSAQEDLAIHFSVGIGNNLDIFTILRRVYIRKCARKTSNSTGCETENSWIVLPIPIEHCRRSTLLHCSSLSGFPRDAHNADTPISRTTLIKLHDLSAFRLTAHNEYFLYYAIGATSFTRRSGGHGAAFTTGNQDGELNPFSKGSMGGRNVCSSDSLFEGSPRNGSGANDVQVEDGWNGQENPKPSFIPIGVDELEEDDKNGADDSDDIPENEQMGTSVAIFSTASTLQLEEIRLLDYLENAGEDKYIGRYAFHPSLPLLAIHCGSEKSGSVILWNFRSSEFSDRVPGTAPRFQKLSEKTMHWTESLQFLACGTQVIIEEYLAERPTVIPISESAIYIMAQKLHDLPAESHSRSAAGEAHSVSTAGTMALPVNEVMLLDPKSDTRLEFHPNLAHTNIGLIKRVGSFGVVQPLLTLPNQSDIRHVNIDILPSTDMNATRIRVMITKSPKLFCSLTDADEDTSTAIVEKEIRALSPAIKRKYGMANLEPCASIVPDELESLVALNGFEDLIAFRSEFLTQT